MNNDQVINLIQTLFKVGGGALAAKGIGDSSLWESIGGAVIALVTWYLSHKWNSTASPQSAVLSPQSKGSGPLSGTLHLLLILGVCGAVVGCNTSQQRIAYNSLYSVQQTTTATVDGFDSLVIAGKVPTNDVPKVSKAYNAFQASFILALDAAQYNTNALAPPNLVVESQDIINLIAVIKGKAK